MKHLMVILFLILAVPALCFGQGLTPDSVLVGPYGVPVMVMSEGGEWSYPLKVYEDAATVSYTPDITGPNWVAWHADQFHQSGKYFTGLYVYSKQKHVTAQYWLTVETRTGTAIVTEPFYAQHIRLSDHATPAFISKSVAKITAIVTKEVAQFHGATVQEVVKQEERMQANMVAENNLPPTRRAETAALGARAAQADGQGTMPVPLSQPEAAYSDEARRKKIQGVCLVGLIVDAQGNPQNVHVVRTLGMGLDEKAVEAVRRYKFKPATSDGVTPMSMYVNVEVNFRLY